MTTSPSISRAFMATFLAVSLAGTAIIVNAWITARHTQAQAIAVIERQAVLDAQSDAMRDVMSEVADDAIQTAAATTVSGVARVLAVGRAFLPLRTRLAVPFL